MKNWMAIPLAALLGLVVGSWGAREDLRLYKAQSQEAKASKKASDAAGFNAFAKMVNIPDVAAKRSNRPKTPTAASQPAATNDPPAAAQPSNRSQRVRSPRLSRADLRARIEEAEELWLTRVELAKTQWKARLGIADEKGSAAFDNALARMNEALLETTTALAAEIEKVDRITPELGLRLMGDASRVMAEAYDELGALVPEDRRGEVSEMKVFDFIDPAVAEPLVGVQDKLDPGWKDDLK